MTTPLRNEFTNNHSDRVERQIMQAKCDYPQVHPARGVYGSVPADDPQKVIEQAEARIAAAKAQIAERARVEAILTRTKHEIALAQATSAMLQAIRSRVSGGPAYISAALVQFRKELSPLAATYGYRIKLVGDKSEAALTEV